MSWACHISTQTLEELAVSKAAGERRLPASCPGGGLTVALYNKKCLRLLGLNMLCRRNYTMERT